MSKKIIDIRKKIIFASFEKPAEASESIYKTDSDGNGDIKNNHAIVDIVSAYAWNNEISKGSSSLSYSSNVNVPICFVIEREQTVASSIMNIVRDANIVAMGFEKVMDGISRVFSRR